MKLFNKLASVLIGSSLVLLSSPVRANTVWDEHVKLWNALDTVGIETVLNDPNYCSEDSDGLYYSRGRTLIVCQDNASTLSSKEVDWTSNDLDTLRHEAHHVIQDCLAGDIGDSELGNYFSDSSDYENFISGSLTLEQAQRIVESYREVGAPDDIILKELEAFAVAKTVSASSIADVLLKVCSV